MTGCRHLPLATGEVYRGTMAVKIKRPGSKILSAVVQTEIIEGEGIRFFIQDAWGANTGRIVIFPKNIFVKLEGEPCVHRIRHWSGKVSFAAGVSIDLDTLVEWMLPMRWPDRITTLRFQQKERLALEVRRRPPEREHRGVIRISDMSGAWMIVLKWLDDPVRDQSVFQGFADYDACRFCEQDSLFTEWFE